MPQRRKRLVAFLPVFVALVVPVANALPIGEDLRHAMLGFGIGISLVALALVVRLQRCSDAPTI